MNYRCEFTVDDRRFFSIIEEERAGDRGSVKLEDGKVIITAKDAVALRAGANSILKLLVTYEKMQAL